MGWGRRGRGGVSPLWTQGVPRGWRGTGRSWQRGGAGGGAGGLQCRVLRGYGTRARAQCAHQRACTHTSAHQCVQIHTHPPPWLLHLYAHACTRVVHVGTHIREGLEGRRDNAAVPRGRGDTRGDRGGEDPPVG